MKLTEAQRRMLIAANDGGVLGFGPHVNTQSALIARGYLTRERDDLGYHNITAAGREALSSLPVNKE